MKNVFLLILVFARVAFAAEEASWVARYRELSCGIRFNKNNGTNTFWATPGVNIPVDAFRKTAGQQTFWMPLKTSYYDREDNVARELTIILALDKIGEESKVQSASIEVTDLFSGREELAAPLEFARNGEISVDYALSKTKTVRINCGLHSPSGEGYYRP